MLKNGPYMIYIAKRVSDCLTCIKNLVRLILVCPLSNRTTTILQKCMQVIKTVKSLTLFKAGKFVIWVKILISCQNWIFTQIETPGSKPLLSSIYCEFLLISKKLRNFCSKKDMNMGESVKWSSVTIFSQTKVPP